MFAEETVADHYRHGALEEALLKGLAAAGTQLLDIDCGLGGASRYFAQHYRCRVTGVALSEEYVAVAASLARRVGLSGQIAYRRAIATELPFPDAAFDGAYMQHVGMNIPDKARLFQ
jgi:MPBQ/MSBQ methyltransferase